MELAALAALGYWSYGPKIRPPRRWALAIAAPTATATLWGLGLGREFASHETVNHLDEWVRGDVHTDTVENFFSILKRGVDGVYHHVSEAHLPRHLAEFDFRYNSRKMTDGERTVRALTGPEG